MKYVLVVSIVIYHLLCVGCSTENPLCTDIYCVEGKIYPRSQLVSREYEDIGIIIESLNFNQFEPMTVVGRIDWENNDPDWIYTENDVDYIIKATLEYIDDSGTRFGENRKIVVHFNKDTVISYIDDDGFVIEIIDINGTGEISRDECEILLTEYVDIATYKGDIIGAPTK